MFSQLGSDNSNKPLTVISEVIYAYDFPLAARERERERERQRDR